VKANVINASKVVVNYLN